MPFLTLRIKRIKVIDNREWLGSGEVKLLSFVTTKNEPLPILDSYFKETDPTVQKNLLHHAVQDVLSSKALMQIDNIKDGHEMIFGDTGYGLWTSRKMIDSFNWQMVLVESDQGLREIAGLIQDIVATPEFDGFLQNIVALAAFSANPSVTLGIKVGKYVINKTCDILMQNKDDQLGVVYQSFYRNLDYPALDRQAFDIPDITGNLRMDYRIYGEDD